MTTTELRTRSVRASTEDSAGSAYARVLAANRNAR
jgi:hypothetical protein